MPTPNPDRLPWEDVPWVDSVAATEKAIGAAQRGAVDPKSPAVAKWARTALEAESAKLAQTPPGGGERGGRNNQLFLSAANLYEIVASGALDESDVDTALRDAMVANGSDDSETTIANTIASGRRKGLDNPRDLTGVGTRPGAGKGGKGSSRNGASLNGLAGGAEAGPDPVDFTSIFALEQGFWTSRESLQAVYLGALARMCAPWSVLAYCTARALATVRPNCVLPPIIGGSGSLNWFAAVAAVSGGGKGASLSVAEELVREKVFVRNLGSGEGLVDSYFCKDDDENPGGKRESVMFVSDEIDSMKALGDRSGSTLMGTLRTAFSGGTLGFAYRANAKHVESHTYRMTLVVNVQPARAGSLMDDKYGGTLQRFMWFPGTDPRITRDVPVMSAPLTLPSPGSWMYPQQLIVPYETTELVRDERVRSNRGESDELAGHALFVREKFAYALAVLDGRSQMNLEDWQLAGIASRVSDRTRAWVESAMLAIRDDEDTEKGRRLGVAQVAADQERSSFAARRAYRIGSTALSKIRQKDGITMSDLTMAIAARDRPYLRAGLAFLADNELAVEVDVVTKNGRTTKGWKVVGDES